MLVTLDLEGIACSMGSTCASGSAEPSPVLLAMGQPPDVWRSSMRFSLGRETTAEEIEQATQIIARAVTRLRGSVFHRMRWIEGQGLESHFALVDRSQQCRLCGKAA